LQNGNFAEFTPPTSGTTSGYVAQEGPPGWFLTRSLGGATVVYDPANAAGNVGGYLQHNELATGFGDNKLDQCVPIDETATLEIAYAIYAASLSDDALGISARIDTNFYATIEDCFEALFADDASNTLGGRAGADYALTANDGQRWIDRTPAEDAALGYTVDDIPAGANFLRLSVRARDRQAATPPTSVRFDNIRVTQGSSANLVVNGRFEHVELFDGAAISGSDGWIVSRDGDPMLKAAVGPTTFAQSGENVFSFEELTGNFGASSLDQCFALNGADIRPSVFARTLRPDPGLGVRVNVDFFTDANCLNAAATSGLRLRQDFPLDGAAGAWLPLITDESRGPGQYAEATHAVLNVRGRDRSNATADGPGEYVRVIYLDDISVAAGVATPTFSPAPGEFVNTVTVAMSSATDGAVIYYTLDGTDPDDTSANVPSGGTVTISQVGATTTLTVRAFASNEFSGPRSGDYTIVAPPPPPPPPPKPLSTGCSIGGEAPFDPTLWILVGLATAGIAWRRRRAAR